MGVIKRQGIKNTLVTYTGILIGFLNVIFIQPRFLTPQELGLIRVLFSFSAILATFLPLGIGSITTRYFPYFKNSEQRHFGFFGVILLFVLIGGALVSLLMLALKNVIIGWYIKESALFTDFFYFVIPLCFFISVVYALTIYCQSLFKSTIPAFLNDVVIRVFSIIVISVYFLKWISLKSFITLFVAVYGMQALLLLLYIFWFDKPGIKIQYDYFKRQNITEMLRYGFLLALTAFASLGIKYIDVVMLGSYLPLALVGIYSVAAFVPTIIEAPIGALEKISNSKIADEWAKNRVGEVEKIYKQSTKYLMLFGGLLLLGVTINTSYLFQLLPKDYNMGVNVVYILSISAFVNMSTGLNGSIILNSHHYRYGSYMLFLLLFLTVINNIFLIPRFGLEGAALATALASFVYNLLKYLFIWIKMKMQPFDNSSLYIVLLILLCYGLNMLIPSVGEPAINIVIHSAVIGIVYCVVAYFLKIASELHQYIPFLGKG
ncbi:MAG: polysaccharide biosynthesis C-terminal domain-containing protein [Bacteroidia bacterium]|nr:polysaccharide biosynthesis C-terminal domain-containing protein [Bacteroidia bacterium]